MNNVKTPCPLCWSYEKTDILNVQDYFLTKEEFNVVSCANCLFQFTYPIPEENKIGKYYETENYLSHSSKPKDWFSKIYVIVKNVVFEYKYSIIKNHIPIALNTKILDLGCGTGFFIHKMQKKGVQVLGLDISKEAQVVGLQNYGVTIKSNTDLYNLQANHFDMISLWHVLEHLTNFKKDLQQIKKILKPSGVLIIAVPNPNSYDAKHYKNFWAAWDTPRHLWHFKYNDIAKLAEDLCMTIVETKLLPFDSFYNAMVSEKYKGSKMFFIKGLYYGTIALFLGLLNIKQASTITYILRENK